MRGLTLADELVRLGAQCIFVCRERNGHMIEEISSRGYEVIPLPPPSNKSDSDWLGVPLTEEIAQSGAILERLEPSRVIVDHYGLDATWEAHTPPSDCPVMVIDDLADRTHFCDILLDQNLGRHSADYDGLIPDGCTRLIGPRFALLRPEFAKARPDSLRRRKNNELKHIMISMGGMDADNATGQILEVIAECFDILPNDLRISIVMGRNAPHIAKVQHYAKQLPMYTEVLVGASDIASLMSKADLAIGAVGGTSWERCCLGLPTLMLVLADNQAPAAKALALNGSAILLGRLQTAGWQHKLKESLKELQRRNALIEISQQAAKLVDGLGKERLANQILQMGKV